MNCVKCGKLKSHPVHDIAAGLFLSDGTVHHFEVPWPRTAPAPIVHADLLDEQPAYTGDKDDE